MVRERERENDGRLFVPASFLKKEKKSPASLKYVHFLNANATQVENVSLFKVCWQGDAGKDRSSRFVSKLGLPLALFVVHISSDPFMPFYEIDICPTGRPINVRWETDKGLHSKTQRLRPATFYFRH